MHSHTILEDPNSIQRRKLLLHHGRTSSMDSCIATTPRRNTHTHTHTHNHNHNHAHTHAHARFGEVCGGTMADVAAVCCCGPCGVANLVVLAVYKAPTCLYRRAVRHKRLKKLQKKGLLHPKSHSTDFRGDDWYFHIDDVEETEEDQKAILELENEMWQKFYDTGFFRSPSRNEEDSPRFQVQPL